MRVLGEAFVRRYAGRLINVHPSLLPLYPGLHTHRRALEDGARIHGCTVHFVTPEVDVGPIIAQAAVPVHDDDDEPASPHGSWRRNICLLPAAVRWFCEGRLVIAGAGCALMECPTPRNLRRCALLQLMTGHDASPGSCTHSSTLTTTSLAGIQSLASPRLALPGVGPRTRLVLALALVLSLAIHLALSFWPASLRETPDPRRSRPR